MPRLGPLVRDVELFPLICEKGGGGLCPSPSPVLFVPFLEAPTPSVSRCRLGVPLFVSVCQALRGPMAQSLTLTWRLLGLFEKCHVLGQVAWRELGSWWN